MYRSLAICLTFALGLSLSMAQDKKGREKGKAQQKSGQSASSGDVAEGKVVFEQCIICHDPNTNEKKMGPGLKGLFKAEKMSDGKKPTEQNVRAKIDDGGNGMPPYKEMLTDKEKQDLMAYLKTL